MSRRKAVGPAEPSNREQDGLNFIFMQESIQLRFDFPDLPDLQAQVKKPKRRKNKRKKAPFSAKKGNVESITTKWTVTQTTRFKDGCVVKKQC